MAKDGAPTAAIELNENDNDSGGVLPNILEGPPIDKPTKVKMAWNASGACTQNLLRLLDLDRPLNQEDLDYIHTLALEAFRANRLVPKRSRACEKCIVRYLGYCPFVTSTVGTTTTTKVALRPSMASDLIGTNLEPEAEGGPPVEREPIDDFLDVSVSDIIDGLGTIISLGNSPSNRKGAALSELRDELAADHFMQWEKEIVGERPAPQPQEVANLEQLSIKA